MPQGSIRELKARLEDKAYKKIKPLLKGKRWYIVAWDRTKLVLRIEQENVQFKPETGAITQRNKL